MSFLRSFVRRLLTQALVSSLAMAGIQSILHLSPALLPFGTRSDATISVPPVRPPDAAGTPAFLQERSGVDIKSGRFAVWRDREAAATEATHVRLASKTSMQSPSDVILFDRCRPTCESRDPLLAIHAKQTATGVSLPERRPDHHAELASRAAPAAVESAQDAGPVAQTGHRMVVVPAAWSGLSWVRRMAETTGGAIGW